MSDKDEETRIEDIVKNPSKVFDDDGFKYQLLKFLGKYTFTDENLGGIEKSFGDILELKFAGHNKALEDWADEKIDALADRIISLEKKLVRVNSYLFIIGWSIIILVPCMITALVTIFTTK